MQESKGKDEGIYHDVNDRVRIPQLTPQGSLLSTIGQPLTWILTSARLSLASSIA